MRTARLEAFSDGVLAIIITIMVLELRAPDGASWQQLKHLFPVLGSYVLSFIYIGIYWNNHHHLLHGTEKINGGIMWANHHLLFWLSLVPFVTGWMGENDFHQFAVRLYGVVLLMAAVAYTILQKLIITHNGKESELAKALGKNLKGKYSPLLYLAGIGASFFNEWIAGGFYVAVALIWLIPEKRIEENIED
ncbi:MAG TPA: TMEM175 family protein [Flavobacterium sp.]|jgi:uncharacterized membrane protein